MQVKSAPGTQCPKENPRKYITDAAAQEVPDNVYYLRLVDDGSLVIVPPPPVGAVREPPASPKKEVNTDGK